VEAPCQIDSKADEAPERQDVEEYERRLWHPRKEERHAHDKPLERPRNLLVGVNDIGAEEGPPTRGEELESEQVNLNAVLGGEFQAESVEDPQNKECE
jgi:hypothetical protein